MHSRDYSDETARVIDEEVERILREQEDRARAVLREHRGGLDLVAANLLEKETIDGAEVGSLVDQAAGRVVRRKPTPRPLGGAAGASGGGGGGENGADREVPVETRKRPPNGSTDPTEEIAPSPSRRSR